MRKKLVLLSLGILAALIVFTVFYAMAASNTMPTNSSVGLVRTPISTYDVVPKECEGITFGGKNELIFGTTGNDILTGGNGNDCIVSGSGNDTLNGGPGNDVLIGGNGNDIFNGGPGNDTCYYGCGTNTFTSCETKINNCH